MADPFIFTTDIPFALPPPFGAARFITGAMLPLLPNDDSLPVLPFLEEFTCVTYIDLKLHQPKSTSMMCDLRAWRALRPAMITLSQTQQPYLSACPPLTCSAIGFLTHLTFLALHASHATFCLLVGN
jgi:hypothetical protein